jgi:ornithine carbamoyltransferase
MKKDLLSVTDLDRMQIEHLIEQAGHMKTEGSPPLLSGRTLALLFEKPSLRTEEVGLGKRESVADVARVLSRYVDGIVARTFSQKTLNSLAGHSSVPVINALSDLEHPCQALSDLFTIYEKKGRLSGLTLAFIGDGNNVANSLLLSACLVGMNFQLASPSGYQVKGDVLNQGKKIASISGSQVKLTNGPYEAVKNADVVYTDVWTSMGQEAEGAKRRLAFSDYQVDNKLLSGLLDDPRSVVFDQAENRLHLQKALLVKLLSNHRVPTK